MPFVSQLRAAQIVIAPGWHGFGATVDGLIARLAETGLLTSGTGSDAGSAVRAREAEASTAMLEIGVGVPHARISGLDAPVVRSPVSARRAISPSTVAPNPCHPGAMTIWAARS